MANNGHFIRLTPSAEIKLNEIIAHFSNEIAKADKSAVVIAAIEEMHKKYCDK